MKIRRAVFPAALVIALVALALSEILGGIGGSVGVGVAVISLLVALVDYYRDGPDLRATIRLDHGWIVVRVVNHGRRRVRVERVSLAESKSSEPLEMWWRTRKRDESLPVDLEESQSFEVNTGPTMAASAMRGDYVTLKYATIDDSFGNRTWLELPADVRQAIMDGTEKYKASKLVAERVVAEEAEAAAEKAKRRARPAA